MDKHDKIQKKLELMTKELTEELGEPVVASMFVLHFRNSIECGFTHGIKEQFLTPVISNIARSVVSLCDQMINKLSKREISDKDELK
jgi:hypothetical protein